MTARKITQFLIIASMLTVASCEVNTRVKVTTDNPPKFTFSGNGILAQMYVSGPYTLDEMKLIARTENRVVTEDELLKLKQMSGGTIWQLEPGRGKRVSDLPGITYGEVPVGVKQIYPHNNASPSLLLEGKYYSISVPSHNANSQETYFIVKNGQIAEVSTDEILKSDTKKGQ